MKKVIIINGTPGAGKTTISRALLGEITNSAWVDGDWCWRINPFIVNEENKNMVEKNVRSLLTSYLSNSSVEVVILSWVINNEALMGRIVDGIYDHNTKIYKFTLICEEGCLVERLKLEGRSQERILDSIKRMPVYEDMDTSKIDTTGKSVSEIVNEIIENVSK